jgi:lysophospholipase L1-like esterase
VLGDSYTEGLLSYSRRLENALGWEVWNSGAGGTGYVNPGPQGRMNFGARLQSDVLAFFPDVVIVAGGLNDDGELPETVGTAAGALYDAILTNLPAAKVAVIGPWWPTGYPSESILNVRDAIKRAALSRGLLFVDPIVATNKSQIDAGWITGSGNASNPHNDGNADAFISLDGIHPTDLGQQYLASMLLPYLKVASLAPPAVTLDMAFYPGLEINGRVGRSYRVQRTIDPTLGTWTNLATLQLKRSPYLWIDTSGSNQAKLFYRAILLP